MNDEEMRAAIRSEMAKHCKCNGVGNEKACNWNCPCGSPVMSGVCENCGKDYLNDLNAMHKAEKVSIYTDHDTYVRYENNLVDIAEHPLHATARQRAIAFCRTLFPERFKP